MLSPRTVTDAVAIGASTLSGSEMLRVSGDTLVEGAVQATELATNDQTGTSYTPTLADAGKTVFMNNVAANVFTIPTNAAVPFPVNTAMTIVMEGAGTTTVEGDTGVTLNGVVAGSADISAQYSAVTIIKRATDTWVMFGRHGTVS